MICSCYGILEKGQKIYSNSGMLGPTHRSGHANKSIWLLHVNSLLLSCDLIMLMCVGDWKWLYASPLLCIRLLVTSDVPLSQPWVKGSKWINILKVYLIKDSKCRPLHHLDILFLPTKAKSHKTSVLIFGIHKHSQRTFLGIWQKNCLKHHILSNF